MLVRKPEYFSCCSALVYRYKKEVIVPWNSVLWVSFCLSGLNMVLVIDDAPV